MKVENRRELKHLLKELDLFKYPGCEVGVAEGLWSSEMLTWGFPKLYCVDAYRTINGVTGDGAYENKWHEANRDKAEALLGNSVTWLIGMSLEMSRQMQDNSLGFLYLDACHSYECVKDDLMAWTPKVIEGGVIALHDFLGEEYGVSEAAEEFCEKHRYDLNLIPDIDQQHAGAWFQKVRIMPNRKRT